MFTIIQIQRRLMEHWRSIVTVIIGVAASMGVSCGKKKGSIVERDEPLKTTNHHCSLDLGNLEFFVHSKLVSEIPIDSLQEWEYQKNISRDSQKCMGILRFNDSNSSLSSVVPGSLVTIKYQQEKLGEVYLNAPIDEEILFTGPIAEQVLTIVIPDFIEYINQTEHGEKVSDGGRNLEGVR